MTFSDRIADKVADVFCSYRAFTVACAIVVLWAAMGPHYDYSDTWQLVINTGTTIVTFLIAFLIGANQRRGDLVRQKTLELVEYHTNLIDKHTDAWEKHAQETHSLAQSTHALVREMHELQRDLHSLIKEVREACACRMIEPQREA